MPSSKRLRLLTVGDGDLSFSLSLIRALGSDQLDLTATVLPETEEVLINTYSNAAETLRELREEWGVGVHFGVDATRLDGLRLRTSMSMSKSKTASDKKEEEAIVAGGHNASYDVIIFNHPHLGSDLLAESERDHALRHHALLAHYMHSATALLSQHGFIHVCLCGTQPVTWDVAGAAQRNGLEIIHECGTSGPVTNWLSLAMAGWDNLALDLLPVLPHYPAPRRYRNGRLGSKHFCGRYGYMHRRTRGDAYGGNAADMKVAESVNILLRISSNTIDSGDTDSKEGFNTCMQHKCRICGLEYNNIEQLQKHQEHPALPDTSESEHKDEETGREFPTAYALKTFESQRRWQSNEIKERSKSNCTATKKRQRMGSTDNIERFDSSECTDTNATFNVVEMAKVSPLHDGQRLRFFCRRESVFKTMLSKKQCESLIKGGLVQVNGKAACDSSRIVRNGDKIYIMERSSEDTKETEICTSTGIVNADRNDSPVKIIQVLPKFVVALKPATMRTKGQFSADTLEMTVTALMGNGTCYTSLTKLETSCPGLCCLVSTTSSQSLIDSLSIMYQYTVLVFGDFRWSKEQIFVTIPRNNSSRRWKNQRSAGTSGEEEDTYESTIGTAFVPDVSSEADHDSQQLSIRCVGKTSSALMTVSTLEIRSTAEEGRLSNIISYLLRKLNHGIVGDRFCKREFSELPRSVRNRLKKKLCMTCHRLEIQGHTVEVPIPEHLQSSWWDHFLSNS